MPDPQNLSESDHQPMSREEWKTRVADVTNQMREFTKKYVAPISEVLSDTEGQLLGTGNYVGFGDRRYILSNEHVASQMNQSPLGHQFLGCEDVFRIKQQFRAFSRPIDVAIAEIEDDVWCYSQHDSAPVAETQWALAHHAVKGELLFLKGYAEKQSKFLFGSLFSSATSYCAQEVSLPADDRFNSRFHFGLDYRPDLAQSIDEKPRDLPDPHGFSGALVWNTRYIELVSQGYAWTPEDAKLTGLVWAWPSSAACLVSTRIEYVRSFLLRVLP